MNKFFMIMLLLAAQELKAQDLEPSSEVVDPLAPFAVEDEPVPMQAAPVVAEPTEVIPEPVRVDPLPTPVPRLAIEVEDPEDFNPRRSHWIVNFGFEAMEYELPWDFTGNKETFKDETRQLYGGRLGFGREFYLGGGFNTTTRIEGFYMGTLFEKATNAGPEQQAETYAYVKRTGHIYGGEASQSLGFLFDFKTKNPFLDEMTYLTVEPYLFAGIGRARSYNRLSYHYDTTIDEDYRHRVQDSINMASLGAGINFTSTTGYFLYLKATQYTMNISKRREQGFSHPHGQSRVDFNTSTTEVDMDPVTVYALGGGFKF